MVSAHDAVPKSRRHGSVNTTRVRLLIVKAKDERRDNEVLLWFIFGTTIVLPGALIPQNAKLADISA